MKIANNPVKYAVVIEQYLHSILDISDQKHWQTLLTLGASLQTLYTTLPISEVV